LTLTASSVQGILVGDEVPFTGVIATIIRDGKKEVTITLNTEKGSCSKVVPAIPEPAPDSDGDGIPDSVDPYPNDPKNTPPSPPPPEIIISDREKRDAIKKLYEFIINKWIEEYNNLGPEGIIRVEEFNPEGSKVHFKILFHFVYLCMDIRGIQPITRKIPVDGYMEDTVDLSDLNSLNDRDTKVTIRLEQSPSCLTLSPSDKEMVLFVSLREIAEVILSEVHKER
jgi:hypothetical protein